MKFHSFKFLLVLISCVGIVVSEKYREVEYPNECYFKLLNGKRIDLDFMEGETTSINITECQYKHKNHPAGCLILGFVFSFCGTTPCNYEIGNGCVKYYSNETKSIQYQAMGGIDLLYVGMLGSYFNDEFYIIYTSVMSTGLDDGNLIKLNMKCKHHAKLNSEHAEYQCRNVRLTGQGTNNRIEIDVYSEVGCGHSFLYEMIGISIPLSVICGFVVCVSLTPLIYLQIFYSLQVSEKNDPFPEQLMFWLGVCILVATIIFISCVIFSPMLLSFFIVLMFLSIPLSIIYFITIFILFICGFFVSLFVDDSMLSEQCMECLICCIPYIIFYYPVNSSVRSFIKNMERVISLSEKERCENVIFCVLPNMTCFFVLPLLSLWLPCFILPISFLNSMCCLVPLSIVLVPIIYCLNKIKVKRRRRRLRIQRRLLSRSFSTDKNYRSTEEGGEEDEEEENMKIIDSIKELELKQQENTCRICFTGSLSLALGCGHVICKRCYKNLVGDSKPGKNGKKCPFCRKTIKQTMKIYL